MPRFIFLCFEKLVIPYLGSRTRFIFIFISLSQEMKNVFGSNKRR